MKQNLKKKIVIGSTIVGIGILIMWIFLFAPQKELVVTMNELPKLDGSEGTSIAYSVYYIWDGRLYNFHKPIRIIQITNTGNLQNRPFETTIL